MNTAAIKKENAPAVKRRFPSRKRVLSIFFSEIFFVLSFIYIEVVFHVSVFGNATLTYPIIFAVPAGVLCGAICDLFPEKVARVLRFIPCAAVWLFASVQKVYHFTFYSFMSISQLGMADDVANNFLSETLYSIMRCTPVIILMALPLVALPLIYKYLKPDHERNTVAALLMLVCFIALQLGAVYGCLPLGGTEAHTPYENYHTNWVPDLGMEKLGLITNTRIDIQNFLFPDITSDPMGDLPSADPDQTVWVPDETTRNPNVEVLTGADGKDYEVNKSALPTSYKLIPLLEGSCAVSVTYKGGATAMIPVTAAEDGSYTVTTTDVSGATVTLPLDAQLVNGCIASATPADIDLSANAASLLPVAAAPVSYSIDDENMLLTAVYENGTSVIYSMPIDEAGARKVETISPLGEKVVLDVAVSEAEDENGDKYLLIEVDGWEASAGYLPDDGRDDSPYNIIEGLDFSAIANSTSDENIKQIANYLATVAPTKKNEYTGMFEGYNLIMLCAESFSPIAVSPELTPTLYKLMNSGFVFSNYWTTWPSNTTNAEYSFLTGLVPDMSKPKKDGTFLYVYENNITMNLTLAPYFNGAGITSRAYHNHTDQYYGRSDTHPCLGFVFKGKEQIGGLKGWPESDLVMMQNTLHEYINDEQFFAYYMTVSGHHPYTFSGSYVAKQNKDLVSHLNYSEAGKAYIACTIELDRALEYLITELEKAGRLDETVFCLSTDHYPYGLTDSEHQELLGRKFYYDGLGIHESALILWNSKMETVKVDKPCCTLDVLPTLLNLFGFDYDSRLYSGRDIFSDTEGIAMTSNQSFILADKVYNSRYGLRYKYYTRFGGVKPEKGELDYYINEVKNRFAMAAAILNHNFYSYLDQELITKAQSWEQRKTR